MRLISLEGKKEREEKEREEGKPLNRFLLFRLS
jgi:hypothetical protein